MDDEHGVIGEMALSSHKFARIDRRTSQPQNMGDVARPLPHNLEAERTILGAILLDNRALIPATEKVRTEDFFLSQHRQIFERMIQLAAKHQPIDLITLMDDLTSRGELESAGGIAYLSQLGDGQPSVTNVEHYARIVKEKATLRSLAYSAEVIREQALAGEDDAATIKERATTLFSQADTSSSSWRDMFHSYDEIVNAPPLKFAVQNFLQNDAATLLAGLSGQYKTWLMLSICKALLEGEGTKLWGLFDVMETSTRILYLIPESGLGPLVYRINKLGLLPYMRDERLLVRTLSKGPAPKLQDPRMLSAAKGAKIFLDTAVRFIEGDESSATDNNRGLAADIFALQAAGAESVFAAAHSPKAFAQQNFMELENMVRGSGDISAVFATAWGVRQLPGDVAHIQNIKPRDFEPCGPFQLAARPHINETGNFQLHKAPGQCGLLADEMPDTKRSNSGASSDARETKALKIAFLRRLYNENPNITWQEITAAFQRDKIEIARGTIRAYKKELGR